ncbi:AraC family transcriptional regulator [Pelistega sp. NLN82]|uniref:AraC family transcriptional regulator n=1 Tax=Pelistega ratti TaxID=2652177 RepID=A0A6L9Y3E8_9BURK|nr:AraC family transcriptional regulator [Pelistega ratti]NEN74823.1 AraC family transcriptional regulator [Pelistega ratti]
MDALTHLFTYFPFRTDLFFIGNLCRRGSFDEPNKGYLHFIRQGACQLQLYNGKSQYIHKPSIIFSPSQVLHHIQPLDNTGLDIFCISFDFGSGVRNPITQTLNNIVVLALEDSPELQVIANQIFEENTKQTCGYQAAVHHLCAFFTIQVVRCCLAKKLLQIGLLQGLTDKYLSGLLLEIHQYPEKNWQVEMMAEKALMSRSSFSSYFKAVMGIPPMSYLANWRIAVAQMLLLKGLPVSIVAEKVGYSHNSVLTRIFQREFGLTPTEWLMKHREMS